MSKNHFYGRVYELLVSLHPCVKKLVVKIQGESWERAKFPRGYYALMDLGITVTLMVRKTITSSGVTLIDVEGWRRGGFCGEIVIHRAKDGTTLAYHQYTK